MRMLWMKVERRHLYRSFCRPLSVWTPPTLPHRRDENDNNNNSHCQNSQSHPTISSRSYHASNRQEILPLVGAVLTMGLGYALYRKLQQKSVFPDDAAAAQTAYQKHWETKERQQQKQQKESRESDQKQQQQQQVKHE